MERTRNTIAVVLVLFLVLASGGAVVIGYPLAGPAPAEASESCELADPPTDPGGTRIGGTWRPVQYRDPLFYECCTVTTDIPYGSAPNNSTDPDYRATHGDPVTLLLDVYEPVCDNAAKRPVYIWVHGGGFKQGSKNGVLGLARQFVEAGWVFVPINYRLHPEASPIDNLTSGVRVDAQHDAQAAVRWVRRHAAEEGNTLRLDPDRIGIGGSSAGGGTTNLVAFNEDDPGSSGNPGFESRVQGAVIHSGGALPVADYTPEPGEPPVAYINAADDTSPLGLPLIPAVATSPCLATIAMGNVCEYHLLAKGGHGVHEIAAAREFLCTYVAGTCPAREVPRPFTVVTP